MGRTTPTEVEARSGIAICKGHHANVGVSVVVDGREMRPIFGRALGTPPTASQRSMGSDFLQRKIKRCEYSLISFYRRGVPSSRHFVISLSSRVSETKNSK